MYETKASLKESPGTMNSQNLGNGIFPFIRSLKDGERTVTTGEEYFV